MLVNAQLNHKVTPLERRERYENPLLAASTQKNYGKLSGGAGTLLSKINEIEWIDFDFELTDSEDAITFVIEELESYGAPKGSKLVIQDGKKRREIPFGQAEGIAVYLNGVDLSPEVYRSCDINAVVAEFNKRLKDHGNVQGHWHGPKESALYIYGYDAELMKELIADFLQSYPLCQRARVVTITPL